MSTGSELQEMAKQETEECGYVVTPGWTYCRTCGGGGLISFEVNPDRPTCPDCHGMGAFKLEEA